MYIENDTRPPSVLGTFYPDDADKLKDILNSALEHEKDRINSLNIKHFIAGGIVPHAGLIYCARQAVHFFEHYRRSGQQADTILIIHPNHMGIGPDVSIDGFGFWNTSLGKISVDRDFADALQLPVSPEAQEREHSAEVVVPYIQHFLHQGVKMVSINIFEQDPDVAIQLAKNIHQVATDLKREILIIASSDFSHFLTPERMKIQDQHVMNEILMKNPEGVFNAVMEHEVTVCGYGPIMTLMEYSKLLDSNYNIHLLHEGHSGQIAESKRVVSYKSLLFEAHRDEIFGESL